SGESGAVRAAAAQLDQIATDNPDVTRRLRAIWALMAIGKLDVPTIQRALQDSDAYVRAWAIQLALENGFGSTKLIQLAQMAESDNSPTVRLYLASALQRLAPLEPLPFLDRLLSHAEDAADPNLPLMYWYALEPLADVDAARALKLAA